MTNILTVRLNSSQRKLLRSKAAAAGKTESALVRELIDKELKAGATVGERAGDLIGSLSFDPAAVAKKDSWSAAIFARNWRK